MGDKKEDKADTMKTKKKDEKERTPSSFRPRSTALLDVRRVDSWLGKLGGVAASHPKLGTSASLLVTSALLVVTSATLVVTSALLVVTMFAIRNNRSHSFLLLLVRHLLLEAMHLFLVLPHHIPSR